MFQGFHPNNQWSFAINAGSGQYLAGGSVSFGLYPNQVWQKNCYNEDGWIDINGGAGTPFTQAQLTLLGEHASLYTGAFYQSGPLYPD
jgi:hypothetical protein